MRAVIRQRRPLASLLSGSGVERVGDYFFAIGDDSPDLVQLDAHWNVTRTIPFDAAAIPTTARTPKKEKLDLEALCCVDWRGRRELLCFGSGSKSPVRDVCFRVDVTDPSAPQDVRPVRLTALYDSMRSNAAIVGAHSLNLEAAASTADEILLFQRGNISNINISSQFALSAFMEYLDDPTRPVPVPRLVVHDLPELDARRAGFSAATNWHDTIVIAASVEDTDNEIEDGAILGSFIGLIEQETLVWVSVVEQNDEIARVKIEGIAVAEPNGETLELVALTDDDEGHTEMLGIEIV